MNRVLFTAMLVGAAAFFLAVIFLPRSEMGIFFEDHPRVEKRHGQAPNFVLRKIKGGQLSLSELAGRPVLLNFWATWCEPCLQEIPELVRLRQKWPDGFYLVLAAADEDSSAVEDLAARLNRLIAEEKISPSMIPVARFASAMILGETAGVFSLLDPGGQVAKRFGTEKYPETYLIDEQGYLRMVFIGPQQWSGEEISRLLDPFFHGREQ